MSVIFKKIMPQDGPWGVQPQKIDLYIPLQVCILMKKDFSKLNIPPYNHRYMYKGEAIIVNYWPYNRKKILPVQWTNTKLTLA